MQICQQEMKNCKFGVNEVERKLERREIGGARKLTPCYQNFVELNGRKMYPFNKGLRIYGGCTTPFLTHKKCVLLLMI